MFETYKTKSMDGKDLWKDFINAFRERNIRSWQRPMMKSYWYLLNARFAYVVEGSENNKKEEFIKLLTRERHNEVGNKEEEPKDRQPEIQTTEGRSSRSPRHRSVMREE